MNLSFVKHLFNKKSIEEIKFEDIKSLIENQIEESIYLEYKEIPKCVSYERIAEVMSGFLNTSGGILVFGVSENNGIPFEITWSKIKKEQIENSLFSRVTPWDEGIKIIPIQNPKAEDERIFIINVPKSKSPPHMANHRYFVRLNFQNKPLEHEQISKMFKQNYLLKYDLISFVYGPLKSILASYYDKTKIEKWDTIGFKRILRDKYFLLSQDSDFGIEIDSFCLQIERWNKALDVVPIRLRNIINSFAGAFFKKKMYYRSSESSVRLDVLAETTNQNVAIDKAILNNKDPINFWVEENEFDKILAINHELETVPKNLNGKDYVKINVAKEDFEKFIAGLKEKIDEDDLIDFVRSEFKDMQSFIEILFSELDKRIE